MDYFVNGDPGFQAPSLALGLLVFWGFVALAAILWMRSLPPKNPARLEFRRRTTNALLVIAGLGILQLVARMFYLDVVEWRLWTYAIFFAGLGYGLYAYNEWRNRLPARANNTRMTKMERPGAIASRKSSASSGATSPQPRPMAMTGRRDARRAKKKKG